VSFVRLACVSYAHIKERLLSGFDDKFNKQLSAKSDRLLDGRPLKSEAILV